MANYLYLASNIMFQILFIIAMLVTAWTVYVSIDAFLNGLFLDGIFFILLIIFNLLLSLPVLYGLNKTKQFIKKEYV